MANKTYNKSFENQSIKLKNYIQNHLYVLFKLSVLYSIKQYYLMTHINRIQPYMACHEKN